MVYLFYESVSHYEPSLYDAMRWAETWSFQSKKLAEHKNLSKSKSNQLELLHFKHDKWSVPYIELDKREPLPKQKPIVAALPFKDDTYSVPSGSTELGEHEEVGNESSESEDNASGNEGALRITTRANVPYHLFGFSKKAMLLLHTTKLKCSKEYDDTVPGKMAEISATFSKFGFEIEQHSNLTDAILYRICLNFFKRDFTDCSCVAVVLLNGDVGDLGFLYVNERDFEIVNNWTIADNPTLQGKPKIYINETNWNYWNESWICRYCVPITDCYHPDVLCFYMPSISYYKRATQPLIVFCNLLATMTDEDLMTIIKETVLALEPQFRAWTFVATTQYKRLYLNADVE